MTHLGRQLLCLCGTLAALVGAARACHRIPTGTAALKSPVDDNYVLSIEGNPKTYVPDQRYSVSLNSYNGYSFVSFMLGLESQLAAADARLVGYFELSDMTETRFSARCPNLVENTNTNPKTEFNVTWVAPAAGSGCVYLRTTVVQHRDVWYKDDGFLTKEMCEEEIDDVDNQPSIMETCCACDEAKYELTFEGKWSRHTHPKDFPANNWRTRFSDIIGASHTVDYRFWQYGELASQGLREVAEHAATKTLESELKEQSDQIRTIIKARGIAYPDLRSGKTFAVFRVDARHHLISLVSMVQPSPDWIVGVSGLELCLANCSWIERKVLNLYPWDVGTDAGPSYMSADQPQLPPDVVRRIKSNYPNDPRSPFYDVTGAPMKPLATLHINRRRLYEKSCESEDNGGDEPDEEEATADQQCATYAWSAWSECSANCGPGRQQRTRDYKHPRVAQNNRCRTRLRQTQECVGEQCEAAAGGYDGADELGGGAAGEGGGIDGFQSGSLSRSPECAVSEWGEWSSCSATCGDGVMMRSRHYLLPRAKKKCQKVSRVRLQETKRCAGGICGGDINSNVVNDDDFGHGGGGAEAAGATAPAEEEPALYGQRSDSHFNLRNFESYSQTRADLPPPECGVSAWSDFSPCLGGCDDNGGGVGQRQRQREVWRLDRVYGVRDPQLADDVDPCAHIRRKETVNCSARAVDCMAGLAVPALCYADITASPCRGLDVANYWYYDHVRDRCALFSTDRCDTNRNKFASKEACEETCQLPRQRLQRQQEEEELPARQRRRNKQATILEAPLATDCIVSKWLEQAACNASCSGEGVVMRVRKVLRAAQFGGKPCPRHLLQVERCQLRCDADAAVEHDVPCRYSGWSAWTPCSATCGGDNVIRQRTRTILDANMTYKCKDRVEVERCVTRRCPLHSND